MGANLLSGRPLADLKPYRDNTDGCLADLYQRLGRSPQRVADEVGAGLSTVTGWLRRHELSDPNWRRAPKPGRRTSGKGGPEKPGAQIDGDTATLVSRENPRGTKTLTPIDLMRQHGLDPTEWEPGQPTLNAWDALAGNGEVTTLHQLKVVCRRRVRVDLLAPARAPGWKPPAFIATRKVSVTEPVVDVICSDPHHPYVEPGLHRAMCRMLADLHPARGFDLGDGLNLNNPSRHKRNPAFDESPQDCIDAEYQCWLDRIAASPATTWTRLPGNHDTRIRDAQLDRLASLHGLRRAQTLADIERDGAGTPVLDLAYLLRLDELSVDLARAPDDGEYHHAQVKLADHLVAKHGTRVGGDGRTGAAKAATRLTCSVVQGHDHKQGLNYVTRWDADQRAGDIAAASVGALCRRDLGYTDDPDVQQGLATLTRWPDGRWHIELARWDAGELVWRDRRYTP